MDEVTQIRVGKHMTGIIGLKSALAETAAQCKGMPDDQIGKVLVERLGKRNYIDNGSREVYAQALVREYRKFIGQPLAEPPAQGLCIQVIGPGCAQCDRLEREVIAILSETGITAELDHVRDLAEIARLGVMGTPALLINGTVKAVGSVPPRNKIQQWLVQAAAKTTP